MPYLWVGLFHPLVGGWLVGGLIFGRVVGLLVDWLFVKSVGWFGLLVGWLVCWLGCIDTLVG